MRRSGHGQSSSRHSQSSAWRQRATLARGAKPALGLWGACERSHWVLCVLVPHTTEETRATRAPLLVF